MYPDLESLPGCRAKVLRRIIRVEGRENIFLSGEKGRRVATDEFCRVDRDGLAAGGSRRGILP
jgi:hypothetical protein